MRAAEFCTRRVIQATPSMSIVDAAAMMRRHQVGALIVVHSIDMPRPIGVLTDRDITVHIVAGGKDPALTPVGEVMTPSVVTCSSDDTLFDVIRLMRGRGVRRIPVLDQNGLLAGIVSTGDVTSALADQLAALSRALVYAPAHDSSVAD